MGVLTGPQILQEMVRGDIVIEPFNQSQLNPNSYNLCLDKTLVVYKNHELDMALANDTEVIEIPPRGLVLHPGKLYLGSTVERIFMPKHVAIVEGRSSVGRLGLCVHVTAGFIDTGFNGTVTLELSVVQPLRVYADTQICQIAYSTVFGCVMPYDGKYQNQKGPQPSQIWREFLHQRNK